MGDVSGALPLAHSAAKSMPQCLHVFQQMLNKHVGGTEGHLGRARSSVLGYHTESELLRKIDIGQLKPYHLFFFFKGGVTVKELLNNSWFITSNIQSTKFKSTHTKITKLHRNPSFTSLVSF